MPETTARRKMTDYATELEWLRFFRKEALTLLGEGYQDRVTEWIRQDFERETRKTCPERA